MGAYHKTALSLTGFSGPPGALPRRFNDPPSWFQALPPERIGLNGEYDYNGLAKRVDRAFQERLSHEIVAKVTVSQRGRVVILQGTVESRAVIQRLVHVALTVEGAMRVETRGLTLASEPRLTVACA